MLTTERLRVAVEAAAKRLRLGVEGPKCAEELEAAFAELLNPSNPTQRPYTPGDVINPDVLPCPFCGGYASKLDNGNGLWYVRCQHCLASGPREMPDKFVEAWNGRWANPTHDPDCICRGNWRAIVKETEPMFGKKFIRDRDGKEFTLYGVVHSDDDYYYGMYSKGEMPLLSCVCSIETMGYTLKDEPKP